MNSDALAGSVTEGTQGRFWKLVPNMLAPRIVCRVPDNDREVASHGFPSTPANALA